MIAAERLPQEFNVASYFVDASVDQGRGKRTAFICEGRTLTYADLQDLANRTGNALLELGVGMEDRVLVLCLDAPEFLGAFWGAIKIGAVPVPVNTLMRASENKHEKTKETLFGPWIQTGDKYWQDEDGYFWYAGRADDMLKVGGIWVSPVEVETTLIRHPAVLEAAVVGAEDEERLVKPKAFVVLKDRAAAAPALADELKAFVKERIAPYKYPRWVEFVSDLPKTATGKIQRFKLRG